MKLTASKAVYSVQVAGKGSRYLCILSQNQLQNYEQFVYCTTQNLVLAFRHKFNFQTTNKLSRYQLLNGIIAYYFLAVPEEITYHNSIFSLILRKYQFSSYPTVNNFFQQKIFSAHPNIFQQNKQIS